MSAARTRHWRRPLLTLGILTLPLWSATFWHHLTRVLDTRNERAACLAFIHARPGWTTADDLPVTLTTPCGTYHQTVALLLRMDQQGVVTIVTQDGATRIGEQHIPVRRT